MQRKQFTFYRSFLEATLALPKKEQLPFVLALIFYALDGEERPLSGSAASAFCIVKPILDNARRKAENGKEGGSKPKANESKPKQTEAKRKQTEANPSLLSEPAKQEKDQVKEQEQVKDQGKDEDEDPPAPLSGCGDVVGVVVRAVGQLSGQQKAELSGFVDAMGGECVLRAVKAAQDAGRPTWGYIRGVLSRKLQQGVRSAEDWDRAEASYQAAKGSAGRSAPPRSAAPGADYQPDAQRAQKNAEWLAEFLRQQEEGGGGGEC